MRERSNRPDRQYATIPNAMIRNKDISMEARGLMSLLMSYSDDWTFRKDHLLEVTGWGRDKFESKIKELRDAGYVDLVSEKGEGGHMIGRTWVIRDDPTEALKTRVSAEALKTRPPENPSPGKSGHIRIPTGKNTNLKENQGSELAVDADEAETTEADLFGEVRTVAEKTRIEEPDRFEEFWAAYPQCKRKTGKAAAKKSFGRMVKAGHDPGLIIAAIKAKHGITSDDPDYYPLPASWLNQERFDGYRPPKANAREWKRGDRPFWEEYVG